MHRTYDEGFRLTNDGEVLRIEPTRLQPATTSGVDVLLSVRPLYACRSGSLARQPHVDEKDVYGRSKWLNPIQYEPPRLSRGPHCLRGWGHDKTNEVFARGP